MPRILITFVLYLCLVFAFSPASIDAQEAAGRGAVHFGTLLMEMHDLAGLARMPDPPFTTVQFSSYDRRSISPEGPEWYSNADGFGNEPIPGFAAVLEEPGDDGEGLYLMADVQGPGAIVRGWSAGMGGVLDVVLDGADTPLFEGPAYDFLARKAGIFLERAGMELDCGDAFQQQDADYLPVPFGKSLRVTWRGKLNELHFYHLEVRRYPAGTRIETFDPARDLSRFADALKTTVRRLTKPSSVLEGEQFDADGTLEPNGLWEWETPSKDRSGAISEFSLRLLAPDLQKALRGTLLRIAFDGAQKSQVEAPVGDFLGTGPGINLFDSLPMAMAEDGTMTCRFVMPYQKQAKVTLLNSTDEPIRFNASIKISPWNWDDRSLYFRAKWRTSNQVDLRNGPFDMPYIFVRGQGRFVGAACMLVNPSPVPHPYGSWWGEGDEKIFVDGEPFPVFFGTGSEDYYNYSWSRPDLFDHPYCGQPLDTGPGNQGFCSNHRWHILDAISFQRMFAFYMEVWHHSVRPGFCYSCIGYHYARPGAIDDHRRIQLSELHVPDLPFMEPEAHHGARDATFHHFDAMELAVNGGAISLDTSIPTASRGHLIGWKAEPGDTIRIPFPVEKEKEYSLNLVTAHRPEGGAVRLLMDDTPLRTEQLGGAESGVPGEEKVVCRSRHAGRLLSMSFKRIPLKPGDHTLTIECVEPGRFGFDYLWVR